MARPTDERKAWNLLAASIGGFSWNPVAFVVCVAYEHPSIQQRFMQSILHMIDSWADSYAQGTYDIRNRETVELAHTIREAIIEKQEAWQTFPPELPKL